MRQLALRLLLSIIHLATASPCRRGDRTRRICPLADLTLEGFRLRVGYSESLRERAARQVMFDVKASRLRLGCNVEGK